MKITLSSHATTWADRAPLDHAVGEQVHLSSKPRTPLYLRQPFPRNFDNTNKPPGYYPQGYNKDMSVFEAGWAQGSLCKCLSCGWLGRERALRVWFVKVSGLRGKEYCPICAKFDIEFYDGLTPNQELLLLP